MYILHQLYLNKTVFQNLDIVQALFLILLYTFST